MKSLQSKSFQWISIGVLAAVAVGVYGFHLYRDANVKALFDGPVEICRPKQAEFYQRADYNLAEYTNPSSRMSAPQTESAFATRKQQAEISYVDGADRDEVEAVMRKFAQQNNTKTIKSNPVLDRLQSPSIYKDPKPSDALQIKSPSDGAVFPPNLCAPYVEWDDARNNLWQVSIRGAGGDGERTFETEERRWRFPNGLWKEIVAKSEEECILQVRGVVRDDDGQRAGAVQASPEQRFRISKDPADDYIVYRLVDPPFSSYKTPNIFIRDIGRDEPDSFLSARRQYCLNCHTFSSKEGDRGKLAMQVRSLVTTEHNLPVYVAIFDMDKQCGYKVQLPFEIQMTTFMAWSPDGNKLAYSANQKVAAIKPITFETQLAGMATSDVAIFDVEKNDTWLVPGASDPNMLEIYPQWTPDGKSLVFSRSPVGAHPSHILYDLYVVDLDVEGEPVAKPIEGAANNNRSNFYPHFSPDRKWFSFTQCNGGDLIRSSSDLYLKSGDLSGPARRLECNVDSAADSWHSWSSNSRWIVFASKRNGGIYAYLYMTHIDDEGRASPAIPLPMEERPFASYNIPEFVAHRPNIKESELFDAMRTETKPRLAQLRKIGQEISHVQKTSTGKN